MNNHVCNVSRLWNLLDFRNFETNYFNFGCSRFKNCPCSIYWQCILLFCRPSQFDLLWYSLNRVFLFIELFKNHIWILVFLNSSVFSYFMHVFTEYKHTWHPFVGVMYCKVLLFVTETDKIVTKISIMNVRTYLQRKTPVKKL